MLFNSRVQKAMEAGLDALWMKQKVISNNIANVDTPNYKAKTVDFEEIINQKIDETTKKVKTTYNYQATISTDKSSVLTLDGNNVDIESQELQLWETYAQYSYLQEMINKEFTNMSYVINNTGK